MRIAIYGAGSLGTILGAFISKAGVPIELINRNKAHIEGLKSKGGIRFQRRTYEVFGTSGIFVRQEGISGP